MTVLDKNPGVTYIEESPVPIFSLLGPDDDTYEAAPKVIDGNVRHQLMLANPKTGKVYDLIKMIAAGGAGEVLTEVERLLGATGFRPNESALRVHINSRWQLKGDGTEDIAPYLNIVLNQEKKAAEFEGQFVSSYLESSNFIVYGGGRFRDGATGVGGLGNAIRPAASVTSGPMWKPTSSFELRDFSMLGDKRRGVDAFGTSDPAIFGVPVMTNMRFDGWERCVFFGGNAQFPLGGLFSNTNCRNFRYAGMVVGGKAEQPVGLSGEDGLTILNFVATNLGIAEDDTWTPTVTPGTTTDVVDWTAAVAAPGAAPTPWTGYHVLRRDTATSTVAGPWAPPPNWKDRNYTQTTFTANKTAGENWTYIVVPMVIGLSIARNKAVFITWSHCEYVGIGTAFINVRQGTLINSYSEIRRGVTLGARGGFCSVYNDSSYINVNSIYAESYGWGYFNSNNGRTYGTYVDAGAGLVYGPYTNAGSTQQDTHISGVRNWAPGQSVIGRPTGAISETNYSARLFHETMLQYIYSHQNAQSHSFRFRDVEFANLTVDAGGSILTLDRLKAQPRFKTPIQPPFLNNGSTVRTSLVNNVATPVLTWDGGVNASGALLVHAHVAVFDANQTGRQSYSALLNIDWVNASGAGAQGAVTPAGPNQVSPRDTFAVSWSVTAVGNVLTLNCTVASTEHQTPIVTNCHLYVLLNSATPATSITVQ